MEQKLTVFLLAIQSPLLTDPPPPPPNKSGLKLVCKITLYTEILSLRTPYRNLKSENSQDYAQKPQQNCTFMNLASDYDVHSNLLQHKGLYTTEYTELQPLLSGVHSVMRVNFALAGEGGGVHAHPLLLHLPSPVPSNVLSSTPFLGKTFFFF